MKSRNRTVVAPDVARMRAQIAAALRQSRVNQHLTQTRLSEMTGLSRPQISIMESGDAQEIGINKFLRLCAALGLELMPVDFADVPAPQVTPQPINNAEIVDDVLRILAERLMASRVRSCKSSAR